jgi:hypothetical protein
MLLMIAILAGRMTRGDYLGGKGFMAFMPIAAALARLSLYHEMIHDGASE